MKKTSKHCFKDNRNNSHKNLLERRVLALLTVSKCSDKFRREPIQHMGVTAPESARRQ
jgi:hypothetical protein